MRRAGLVRRRRAILAAVIAAVAALLAAANAVATTYTVTNLGVLPGAQSSSAVAINELGQVVGDSAGRAFLWQNGTMSNLGTLPGGTFSTASGLNDLGQVVGRSNRPDANGSFENRGFLFSVNAGGNVTSRVEIGTESGTRSEANDINNSGVVVGAGLYFAIRGFSWAGGSIATVDNDACFACNTIFTAISDTGNIVGNADAFIYAPGAGKRYMGGLNSRVFDVNDSGQATGSYTAPSGFTDAFVWSKATGLVPIDPLPFGSVNTGEGINSGGEIVGWSMHVLTGVHRAFLYRNGSTVDLNTLLPPSSGWDLRDALDINDSGQIVGVGAYQGEARGFLLTPVPSDSVAPTVAASASPSPNAEGWNSGDVVATITASDEAGGSGVKNITYSASGAQPIASTTVTGSAAQVTITAEGVTVITFTAVDEAGNQAPSQTLTIRLDKSAPALWCAGADGNWHADNVALSCSATDAGSGLADPADGSFSLSTAVPAGVETAAAATDSRSVCDRAGNCATAGPIGGNKVDGKAPSISVGAPASGVYLLNAVVASSYGCSDGGAGVASCSGPVASGSTIDTRSVSSKSFTVVASDTVGNSASQTVSYNVAYDVFLLYDPTKPSKTIKLQLRDANGANVSDRRPC